jgi:UDP-glucose 4-epimerase
MERVVPLFMDRISWGEEITIYGREKVLDFTYIDDCTMGIRAGMERLLSGEVLNQTINLAYGEGNSLGRLAELIGAALGVEPRMDFAPSRLGEVTHYVADISKAGRLLGYAPQVPLAEGVRRAVEWRRSWERGQSREL